MNLPHSTYYHKPKNESGDDRELITYIEAIIEEFPGYGYRRVTHPHKHGLRFDIFKPARVRHKTLFFSVGSTEISVTNTIS